MLVAKDFNSFSRVAESDNPSRHSGMQETVEGPYGVCIVEEEEVVDTVSRLPSKTLTDVMGQ